MNYIDSHAHVHDKAFDADRDEVVERMRESGVETAVLVGCDADDSRKALATAQRYSLFASAGIHPHEAKSAPADMDALFEELCADQRVRAIGETGLDYYYDHSPRDVQQGVLRAQLDIARQRGLPVIFHHRDAFDDFVAILRERFAPPMRGVIHCFTGDTSQAEIYTKEFGLLLGIGGAVTFKSAQQIREAVRAVGVEPLILETDCPYLAPAPNRGKRNEPAFVPLIAARVAAELELDAAHVAATTTRNARALFNL